MIMSCSCKHVYQDAKYGPGRRMHNPCKPIELPSTTYCRCTICEKEKVFAPKK